MEETKFGVKGVAGDEQHATGQRFYREGSAGPGGDIPGEGPLQSEGGKRFSK